MRIVAGWLGTCSSVIVNNPSKHSFRAAAGGVAQSNGTRFTVYGKGRQGKDSAS